MSWYKRAKTFNIDSNYLDIGHSGFLNQEYGCNHIYILTKEGQFLSIPETKEVSAHGYWLEKQYENNIQYIYKGRIDTCKKVASLTGTSNCHLGAYSHMNGSQEAFCERMKHLCKQQIYHRFGNDINIIEF